MYRYYCSTCTCTRTSTCTVLVVQTRYLTVQVDLYRYPGLVEHYTRFYVLLYIIHNFILYLLHVQYTQFYFFFVPRTCTLLPVYTCTSFYFFIFSCCYTRLYSLCLLYMYRYTRFELPFTVFESLFWKLISFILFELWSTVI